jgi:dephospho-CoA kinase
VTAKPIYRILRKRVFQGSHILCVVGTIGSGKSLATQWLREDAEYAEINSGRVLARLMDMPPIPQTPRPTFQQAAQSFISAELGPKVLAYGILEEAKRLGASRIIVDGIRHRETLNVLRDNAKHPIAVLYIHTPPDVAYELYTSREAPQERLLPAEFAAVQNAAVESQVRYFIEDADAIVYNWFGVDSYRFVLRELVREVGVSKSEQQQRRLR